MVYSNMLSHLALSFLAWSIHAQPVELSGVATSASNNISSLQSGNASLAVDGTTWFWADDLTDAFNKVKADEHLSTGGVRATDLSSLWVSPHDGERASSPNSGDRRGWKPTFVTFLYSRNGKPVTGMELADNMGASDYTNHVYWSGFWRPARRDEPGPAVPLPWPPELTLPNALNIVKPKFDKALFVKEALYRGNTDGVYWDIQAGRDPQGYIASSDDAIWRVYVNGTTELIREHKSRNAAATVTTF